MMKYNLVFEAIVEDECCATTRGFNALVKQSELQK